MILDYSREILPFLQDQAGFFAGNGVNIKAM
jgi:hypothetical protein